MPSLRSLRLDNTFLWDTLHLIPSNLSLIWRYYFLSKDSPLQEVPLYYSRPCYIYFLSQGIYGSLGHYILKINMAYSTNVLCLSHIMVMILSHRGTLHLKSLKSSSPSPSSFQQLPLPASNLTSLRLAAKYGGYYFIRARSKFTDLLSEKEGSSEGDYVITFISAVSKLNPLKHTKLKYPD